MIKVYQDQNWLWEHYIVRKESMYTMAKEAKCSYCAINNWLHRYGIPVRSRGEGVFLANRNSVTITPDFLEFLRGELLGDGCVTMPGNRSARYEHSSKYEECLIWLSERFDGWGIEQVGRIRRYIDKQHGAISYRYVSRSYPELVPIYKRWYTERGGKMKKIVPQDLKLTPIMARQWYLGDGGLENNKPYHSRISFATCDFDRKSIDYLIKELQRQGFKATYRSSNNTIGLSAYSVPDFLSWIGPCPISCYDYKWDYEKRTP